MEKITRGIRNNNPLNIRRSKANWKGKLPLCKSSDKVFEQFENMYFGLRAAKKLLWTYYYRHKLHTAGDIIARWAPPSENYTSLYIEFVVWYVREETDNPFFNATTPMNWNSLYLCTLLEAMCIFESNYKCSATYIAKINID